MIADFRANKKPRETKIEKQALSLPVEMLSEYIAVSPNFLACSVTRISSVTTSECCRNKIVRKWHLNLKTPNLHIMQINSCINAICILIPEILYFVKNFDTLSRLLMCTFQELRYFKDENVSYSQLKNNKKQKKLKDFIFFVFYCF